VQTVGSSGDQRLLAIFFLPPWANRSETLAWPDGHGGSPRGLPRHRRVDGVKQISTVTSVMGGSFGFGSGKWFACKAEKACSGARQGPRSSAPRSIIRAGLGWYYRVKYTLAEREVRDGPDRRHSSPLPCITKLKFPPFFSAIEQANGS
jgi:hypothetical protein